MTRDEIVTALREHAERAVGNEWGSSIIMLGDNLSATADLIENQQRHIEALLQANAALRNTVLRRDGQIADMSEGLAQFAKAVAVEEEQSELHAMKNELCQYCGKYKHAHEGACDGCKWRKM